MKKPILQLMREKDELLAKRQVLLDKIVAEERGYKKAEREKVENLQAQISAYDEKIEEAQDIDNQRTGNTPEEIRAALSGQMTIGGFYRPGTGAGLLSREFQPRGFTTSHRNFGEFIHDARFQPDKLRALEMGVGAAGGFTVPDQFVGEIFAVTPESSIVRPRATMVPGLDTSPDAASEIPALDHTAGTHGGITVSWIGEGVEKPETEPEFIQIKLDPQELAGHLIVTDKLLRNNAANLSVFLEKTFREAIFAAEDDAFLNGNGVGLPLGVLNSPARIQVARAGANAFAYADVAGMLAAFTPDSWLRGVWVINLSVLPQLMVMVDAGNHRVFEGKDNMRGLPPSLIGIPVIFTGRVPPLGTTGDVMLCDFSYYLLKQGFGPAVAASQHPLFKQNKTIVKAFHNVDGQPWVQAPITLEDGVTTVSPFVVLEA